MVKVIQFLILGFAILHLTQAQAASTNNKSIKSIKSLISEPMGLNEFVNKAMAKSNKKSFKRKVELIKTFNQFDTNGDLVLDNYEIRLLN